jgi:hypothetical protein
MGRLSQRMGILFLEGRKPIKLKDWAIQFSTSLTEPSRLESKELRGYPIPREGLNFRLYPSRSVLMGFLPEDHHFWGVILPGGTLSSLKVHPQQRNPDVP